MDRQEKRKIDGYENMNDSTPDNSDVEDKVSKIISLSFNLPTISGKRNYFLKKIMKFMLLYGNNNNNDENCNCATLEIFEADSRNSKNKSFANSNANVQY
jgi:hypothetical protein